MSALSASGFLRSDSRKLRFSTFPAALRGNSVSVNCTIVGTLNAARRSRIAPAWWEHRAWIRRAGARPRRLLAVALVGNADDRGFDNVGVLVQRSFHLGRVDVLAAADHHVFDAIGDVEEPLLVERARSPVWNQPSVIAAAVAPGFSK